MSGSLIAERISKLIKDDIRNLEKIEEYHVRKLEEVKLDLETKRKDFEKLEQLIQKENVV